MRKLLLSFAALSLMSRLSFAETLVYQNKDSTKSTTVIRAGENGHILITNSADSIICSSDWSTLSAHHDDHGSSIADFVREGNKIRIKGTLKGAPVDKTVAIDESPWFMDPVAELKYLVAKGERQQEFWVINANDYKATKLIATYKGEEDFVTPAGTCRASRYVISVAGLPVLFWSANAWIRACDSVGLSWNKENFLSSASQ